MEGGVLFVCRGNLCRSPMAMAILSHKLSSMIGRPRIRVESAGYYEWGAFPREAHPFARRAVAELCGADLLADHVARRWSKEVVMTASRVVVAEEWMRADFPADRVVTMRQLGGEKGDVEDPYGADYPIYVECARLIDRLLNQGMAWLLN